MVSIEIQHAQHLQKLPDSSQLGFGRFFTDHMFMMNFNREQGWHKARIVPYQSISLSPSSMVFHYAQEIFEGLKAYRTSDGSINLFRPSQNIKRLNQSAQRLCMPQLDEEDVLQAIKMLVKLDASFVPYEKGTSLYIRPFLIATEPHLGVHPSNEYLFMIICSPVGSYYANGLEPVKIYIEDAYVRAVKGGTGFAKTGGNYASSLIGQEKAEQKGYAQVLWLDGVSHQYVDEVGAMNVFFVIEGRVVTPSLESGTILSGITRDSCIHLLKSFGFTVEERKVALAELIQAHQAGTLTEAFGTGTAAVISPIGELANQELKMPLNNGKIGPIAQKLYETLTNIQWGMAPDSFNWIEKVL